MTTIRSALVEAKNKLMAVSDVPHLEAEILLSHAIQEDRVYLYAWPEDKVDFSAYKKFIKDVQRRCQHEPLAYITGYREFWSLNLRVTPSTLIPRPETECLVEEVLKVMSQQQQVDVADLGTGSGAIILALATEKPHWQCHAVDNSESALLVAQENAGHLGVTSVTFHQGDWCAALPHANFDVIVSNPPYIAETEWVSCRQNLQYEPVCALVSGQDGLTAIREIAWAAMHYLRPGGYLLLEHGATQGENVCHLLSELGYSNIYSIKDRLGLTRVTVGICSDDKLRSGIQII